MRWLIAALLAAAPAFAQEGELGGTQDPPPPETSPAPEARPDPEEQLPEDEPVADDAGETEAAARAGGVGVSAALSEDDETFEACLAELDALGAGYEVIGEPISENDPDCGISRPVLVSEAVPGVALSPPATLRCETAVAAARWTATHLQPAAELVGRGPLVSLDLGGSYVCRRRNHAATGKLSEHSFGNAIDVMGFSFADGERIAVEPREDEGTLAESFQRAARASSCLYFTTVLGPGTDATHEDHLHMDVKERRGGYRICQ